MNTEIYQLVKYIDRTGMENLSYEEKRVELWQRAVREWNKTHTPVATSLEDVYRAFKYRWPQIYGGEPCGNELYLSFSYIDYLFFMNSEGLICGGICLRDGKRFCVPINMMAEQIVELAGLLRIVPEDLPTWEEDENNIRECDEKINNGIDYNEPGSEEWVYLTLQMQAVSQYMLGMFEESINTVTRAMICFNYHRQDWNSDCPAEKRELFEMSDATSLAELYTQLADNLVYTFRWNEAEWCFKLAYMQHLDVFEREDWTDYEYRYMDECDRKLNGQDKRCIYLNWAWSFAQLYIKEHRNDLAIPILEKAENVAKDMNEKESGRWIDNLNSISKKLTEIKEEIYE